MVREIRIYIEGGGNDRLSWRKIRAGFGEFFDSLRRLARSHRIEWSIITGGPRSETFKEFRMGIKRHPDAFNVLLVDSESPVGLPRRIHLQQQDRWDMSSLQEDQCHLMVQAIEAWLVADPDAMAEFYGQGFRRNALPRQEDVEAIAKGDLMAKIESAVKDTQKRTYKKIDHCAELLKRLNPQRVRVRAHHCDLLFKTLEARITGS
ncbi:MAG TPA: DUF4276 family protein [Thermoanaerobaculia bacterium]|jgi:hypothetical protein|nr:DUF4276 family protein [Thermoanaerobaculia bacterium]